MPDSEEISTLDDLDFGLTQKTRSPFYEVNHRIAQLIEFLPDPTFAIDDTGRVIFWNEAMEELSGVRSDDILGKSNYEYALPFYGKRQPVLIDLVIKRDDEAEKKYSSFQWDGESIYAEGMVLAGKRMLWAKASPMYDEKGRLIGSIESIRDITEKKEIEQAHGDVVKLLQKNEEIIRVLFNQSSNFFGILDGSGKVIKVNPSALKFAGTEEKSIIGEPFADTPWWSHSKAERERLCREMEKAVQGEFVRFETNHRDIDGKIHYIDFSIKPVKDAGNHVLLLIPEGHDITERKLAEQAMQKSEEKYRAIFENASEGIFQTTPEGRFLSVNPSLATMFGYSSPRKMIDSVNNIGLQHYVKPQDRDALLEMAKEQGKVEGYEVEIFRKDRSKFWASINLHTVCDAKGALLYFEGTNIDITERKLFQLELENTKKELENMNTALRVMLKQMDKEKDDMEQNIILNIKSSVFPFLGNLKTSGLTKDQMTCCSEIEHCLNDITSSFIKDIKELSSKNTALSSTELQIASLIKEGKPSKEIAKILNISVYTVTSHRYHIRKKIGLNGRDKNLKAYLNTLK